MNTIFGISGKNYIRNMSFLSLYNSTYQKCRKSVISRRDNFIHRKSMEKLVSDSDTLFDIFGRPNCTRTKKTWLLCSFCRWFQRLYLFCPITSGSFFIGQKPWLVIQRKSYISLRIFLAEKPLVNLWFLTLRDLGIRWNYINLVSNES